MRWIAILTLLSALVTGVDVLLAEELKPGMILDQSNWQLARDLLPPEILQHYQRGEFANTIIEWQGPQRWSQAFLAATEQNANALTVNDKGSIVEKATGASPAYLVGIPFPKVTADDPQAAIKILWNQYLTWWYTGNFHDQIMMNWVSPRGVEHSVIQNVYFLYYQGQPREYVPPANPNDLLAQFLAVTESPADVYGTTALSWRYRDSDKRDAMWAYVPALRRARAVSPSNRSDGFLGSDMSQDDGPFFDGKPEDFTWKLVGEQEVLRLFDQFSLSDEMGRVLLPGGGERLLYKKVPIVGFQDPAWKGLPWAPVTTTLVRRRCWIIEGVPKDKYYLFGKIQLYIDKEDYRGAYNRKFSWQGELMNSYAVFAWRNTPSVLNKEDYYMPRFIMYQGAENVKLNRATVITAPLDQGDPYSDRRLKLSPDFFQLQSLGRMGK